MRQLPAMTLNAVAPPAPRKTVLALLDTPNLMKSAMRRYGPGVWVDYARFRQWAFELGNVRCEAIVNGGVSPKFIAWLKSLGYSVTFSRAEDTDEMLVTRCVLQHRQADSVVIASGDGKNIELIRLLNRVGVGTVVAAIDGSIHRELRNVAGQIVDFPVRFPPLLKTA